jgi:urease accessory protein
MIVCNKCRTLSSLDFNKSIDWLGLEWYESNKRILHKRTQSGVEIALKFLQENPALTEGDVLFEDENTIIAVQILPCDAIVIKPINMFEMASVCYEIGNKHLPLFYENDTVLVPFDAPLFRLLTAQGYSVTQAQKKLVQPLKTSVLPHGNGGQSESLFSKIMKLTSPNG